MAVITKNQKPIKFVFSTLAALVALLVGIYALYLLLRGIPSTVVPETPLGGGEGRLVYFPAPQACVPLIAAILLLGGLLGEFNSRKLLIMAWAGWGILALFAGLFVFSIGAPLLPAAGIILIFLTIINVIRRR